MTTDRDHDHSGHRDVGDHSGYAETGVARVAVLEDILAENDRVAAANRADFAAAGVWSVNVMSSPGAGKTTLLKRTLAAPRRARCASACSRATSPPASTPTSSTGYGAAISLVNTSNGFGGECHLDAVMVRSGLGRLPLADLDLLLIENVGNLVCPAEFDVGQHARAMVYAVTEGEEKPLKYPVMFRAVDVVVVNKIDLLPHLDVDLDRFLGYLHDVNPDGAGDPHQRPHRRGRRRVVRLAARVDGADMTDRTRPAVARFALGAAAPLPAARRCCCSSPRSRATATSWSRR